MAQQQQQQQQRASRNMSVAQFREMVRTDKLTLHKLEKYGSANQMRMSIVLKNRTGGRLGDIQLGITPGAWKENPANPERITTKWGLDWFDSKSGAPEPNKQKLDLCMQLGSETVAMIEEFDAWVRNELVAQSVSGGGGSTGSYPFGKPLKRETVDVLVRGGINVSEDYGEAHLPSTVLVDKLKLDLWDPVSRKLRKNMPRKELVSGSVFLVTIRPTLVWFGWEASARDLKIKSWGIRWDTSSVMVYHLPMQDDIPPFDLDDETIQNIRAASHVSEEADGDGEPEPSVCGAGAVDAPPSLKRARGRDELSVCDEKDGEAEATLTEEEAWASAYPMP